MAQILIYGFVTGTQVLLLALALFLVYAVSKVQNFALGAMGAGAAYTLYSGITSHLPILLTILLTLVTAVLLGVMNFFLNEPLTKKHEYLLALLTSFSFAIVLESLISIVFGTDGKNLTSGVLSVFKIGALQVPIPGLVTVYLGVFVAVIAVIFLRYTSWGRTLRAIAENSSSTEGLGVNSRKVRFFVYIVASIVAGMIVILVGLNTALTPTMGFQLVIMAFIAFLVGGVSDIKGTIIASYLVTLIPESIMGSLQGVSSNWKMVLVFVVAFVLLAFRPNGLFSYKQREG